MAIRQARQVAGHVQEDLNLRAFPDGLVLAWYGDDFTGAAAVMEVLAFAGLPTMLFIEAPTREQLARFGGLRAIGVASTARAQTPDWMDRTLPGVFSSLMALGPQLLHYKTCSTLDSAPHIGSIGRAIEIGADLLNSDIVPVLVAAPQMRRYQMFGHLFAGHGDQVYRLDRHPVMSRHPVTPMTESDVAAHISAQSARIVAQNWSIEEMKADSLPLPRPEADIAVLTLDAMDEASEVSAGGYIWANRANSRFVVGSQGVEYALLRHWIDRGALKPVAPPASVGRSNGMVSVSGSVSPTTAGQIAWSRDNGFATIRFDAALACVGTKALDQEVDRVVTASLQALDQGNDPLIYTAEGPDDPDVARFHAALNASPKPLAKVHQAIGTALGHVLAQTLARGGVRRAVVSGGDTSGYATAQLGIFALSALAPTIPGASLLRAHANGPMNGLELALKGGQMGSPDYFGWIRDGGGLR